MISNDLNIFRTDFETCCANEAFELFGGPDDIVARHCDPIWWPDTVARHCGPSAVGPALWPDIVALAFGH